MASLWCLLARVWRTSDPHHLLSVRDTVVATTTLRLHPIGCPLLKRTDSLPSLCRKHWKRAIWHRASLAALFVNANSRNQTPTEQHQRHQPILVLRDLSSPADLHHRFNFKKKKKYRLLKEYKWKNHSDYLVFFQSQQHLYAKRWSGIPWVHLPSFHFQSSPPFFFFFFLHWKCSFLI